MQIEFKPLPAHWSYLLSCKVVKQLVADLDIDCRLVQYLGTSNKPSKITSGLYSAGGLDARSMETGWCFRLQLWGLPDRILADRQEELSILLQEDIQAFVLDRHRDLPAALYPPLDRRFFLRFKDNNLVTDFSTWTLEEIEDKWANRSPWWT
ncbi:hypothetical protein [Chamaesiphon polymorphus]|uniref:Uncharacterized protein n=1 Tax=Chamaesiphon polymorphus CCALA 037 TaxID=2107692 RepID=A0A2T1GNG2_9CYAN|nr:hypothetical protein [Chamaesiphon polymorphus]PSB59418.1 hypothetical protein C7B77_00925 [Chamaesiphon polymorphus CCALA 037]